nr:MAG TPA: hypothetical protein [Caudoviricetes sp.]
MVLVYQYHPYRLCLLYSSTIYILMDLEGQLHYGLHKYLCKLC